MVFEDVVVLLGRDLEAFRCARFEIADGKVVDVDRLEPVHQLEQGGRVIIPGLINAHTHMGDSFLPDGATGMTLEEGFFRPNGYKYRQLAAVDPEEHLPHVVAHLKYMARSGTVCHIDFREQGLHGCQLLREASKRSGVRSMILGQFAELPFTAEELRESKKELSESAESELRGVLGVADGFSESTMNDLTCPSWKRIREITEELGKYRAIHCLENEGYRDESLKNTGRGDLERAINDLDPDLIIHLTVANAEEIKLLVDSQKTGVLNPRANANLGLPLPPIKALLDAGANLLLGTDNGLLNSPNMLAELDFTYKVTKSQYADSRFPNPVDILKMATSNAEAVFGVALPGYLEVGLPASFAVLDFDRLHLRRSRNLHASILTRVTPEDVLATYRDGVEIYSCPEASA
ncbi:MAG: amidohydrolase family protein [Opitutales bacterium]